MLRWERNITIDESVVYHVDSSWQGTKFDDWVKSLCLSAPPSAADVVLLPMSVSSTGARYIVEVKDFRPMRGQPGDKNTKGLPANFLKKVTTVLTCFQGTHDFLVLTPEDRLKWGDDRETYLVLHVEMPPQEKSVSSVFPANFPINLLQTIRSRLPAGIARENVRVIGAWCTSKMQSALPCSINLSKVD